jgi:uncharacterized protein
MKKNDHSISRRSFLQTSGVLGLGALLASSSLRAAEVFAPTMPKRKFGKTGVDVPVLTLGGIFDTENNQHVLRQAFDYGVRYWDTAEGYGKGGSERGMGNYFAKNPAARKGIFLVSKTHARTAAALTASLDESLARLKTDYIDLYFFHGVTSIDEVDRPGIQQWIEATKKSGKIRFFGFSTHSQMPQCLLGASKLGWIDGIMLTYNYRLMNAPDMKQAVEACAKAGVGLTAMKAIGRSSRGGGGGAEAEKLLDPIKAKGFSPEQAALKAVWDNPAIATICALMANTDHLAANVAAALDRTKLAATDRAALQQYAAATCNGYCAGCSQHCENALGGAVPVQTVMRRLMYHHHYGPEFDPQASFAAIPEELRLRLAEIDYTPAERACPHHLPIGQMMREAQTLLA